MVAHVTGVLVATVTTTSGEVQVWLPGHAMNLHTLCSPLRPDVLAWGGGGASGVTSLNAAQTSLRSNMAHGQGMVGHTASDAYGMCTNGELEVLLTHAGVPPRGNKDALVEQCIEHGVQG